MARHTNERRFTDPQPVPESYRSPRLPYGPCLTAGLDEDRQRGRRAASKGEVSRVARRQNETPGAAEGDLARALAGGRDRRPAGVSRLVGDDDDAGRLQRHVAHGIDREPELDRYSRSHEDGPLHQEAEPRDEWREEVEDVGLTLALVSADGFPRRGHDDRVPGHGERPAEQRESRVGISELLRFQQN